MLENCPVALTGNCAVGDWDPTPSVTVNSFVSGSTTTKFLKATWSAMPGAVSYNICFMRGSNFFGVQDICHFLAFTPACGRWNNYDYKSPSGYMFNNVLNGGYYNDQENIYYAIMAVNASNQITVSKLYKVEGTGTIADGSAILPYCETYVNGFFTAEPPPVSVVTTPAPKKGGPKK